ncbi:hypothetical protein FACS1894184_16440 [Clostridia bacterium]|nr:hypothetical protein FACS1894184_16440 [Clostridia bacterium]
MPKRDKKEKDQEPAASIISPTTTYVYDPVAEALRNDELLIAQQHQQTSTPDGTAIPDKPRTIVIEAKRSDKVSLIVGHRHNMFFTGPAKITVEML